ncbi:MAG: thiol protease/hemagglutinin PrtT [Bacteroidales bacterium]|nr:thiol protease/hemagglutinin PrtT [Bacteroidales bacterium]
MNTRIIVPIVVGILLSLFFLKGNARPVTLDEARVICEFHLTKFDKLPEFSVQSSQELNYNGMILGYIFDLEPQGYVIVPALTRLPPVLVYSFESKFGNLVPANPLFELITADLARRIETADMAAKSVTSKNEDTWKALLDDKIKPRVSPLFEQWPASGDGWLKTNWTQSFPYNNLCPMDPVTGLRSYAGCPATAMAQVMNFHGTTNDTHFDDADDYYHNYAGRQYWIDDDFDYAGFPSFPELNTFLDTQNAHYECNTPLTDDDMAALTFACGVAARQVFTSQGSGTFGVGQAYDAYLRFGCSTADLLDSNDADLFGRLSQNIKDTLPAHLAVVDVDWATGHNMVVDGYNTDEYYHLNFGWGGSYNGWYLLPQEIPYDLTVIEGVVVDIMKKNITGTDYRNNLSPETYIYPNPSSGVVYLNYRLYSRSTVSFGIYKISGENILTCMLKDQAPGNHSLPLSFDSQPSGIYIYQIQTASHISSGKIIKME